MFLNVFLIKHVSVFIISIVFHPKIITKHYLESLLILYRIFIKTLSKNIQISRSNFLLIYKLKPNSTRILI